MNYYEARQHQATKLWKWTCMNDGRVWESAPCDRDCPGHPTKEEAERHFYDHRIAALRERTYEGHYECKVEGCRELSNKTLESGHGFFGGDYLCDEHRTPEVIEQLHPFTPGIRVASSW